MKACACTAAHRTRRVVLTGGPGAGKTAVLSLFGQYVCQHVIVLSESAGLVFGGGFPRGDSHRQRRAAQRAIFFVQRELEACVEDENAAVVLCDRGTIDGVAYWPGPEPLWDSVGTTVEAELQRYDAVIHLRTPSPSAGYDRSNPLRIETAEEAADIDERIAQAWTAHPRRFFVDATPDFLVKARQALALLRDEVPACCGTHSMALLDAAARAPG